MSTKYVNIFQEKYSELNRNYQIFIDTKEDNKVLRLVSYTLEKSWKPLHILSKRTIFFSYKSGSLRVYVRQDKSFRSLAPHELSRPMFIRYSHYIWKFLRDNGDIVPETDTYLYDLKYPAFKGLPGSQRLINYNESIKAKDFKNFVQKYFGRKNYRKDLLKATLNSSYKHWELAKEFVGLIPIDWVIRFLSSSPTPYSEADVYPRPKFTSQYSYIRHIYLKNLDAKYLKIIFNNIDKTGLSLTQDTIKMILDASKEDLKDSGKTTREIHDHLSRINSRKIDETAFPKTRVGELFSEIDYSSIGLECKIARKSSDLNEWSKEMSNCISGYKQEAISGEQTFLGFYRDGELIANANIREKDFACEQLLGKYNQFLSEKDWNDITNTTKEKSKEYLKQNKEIEIFYMFDDTYGSSTY